MNNLKNILLISLSLLLFVCCNGKKRYLIGVSQCSEDIWRDKLNSELITSTYFYDNVDLKIETANDNIELQKKQIEKFIADGIDLLIVSPIQTTTISPAIEKAYDKGIPVIVFDRKSSSEKYTAYIGADNEAMGHEIGEYIAAKMKGKGTVVEIWGLHNSSPSIERDRGFTSAMKAFPGIKVERIYGDWKEESGYKAMKQYLTKNQDVDFVFGQNDRMALGARKAVYEFVPKNPKLKAVRYCGVDALPTKDGGMELVRDGELTASYIYPTQGDQVMQLAINILEKKPYKRFNGLRSAFVTSENAKVLLMQSEEIERKSNELGAIYNKTITQLERRGAFLWGLVIIILLLIILMSYAFYANHVKTLFNKKLNTMQQIQDDFYTDASHSLRTPLTLIASPVEELVKDPTIGSGQHELLVAMKRNVDTLVGIVNRILEFKKDGGTALSSAGLEPIIVPTPDFEPLKLSVSSPFLRSEGDSAHTILVVDDNADIRYFVRFILQNKYKIIEACDGKEGLKIAQQEIPELIISDIMMPEMNGLDFCQAVKDDVSTSHIPVILLTARSREEQKVEGYEHGADAYLTKPFTAKLLQARVENLLSSRKNLQRLFERTEMHLPNLNTEIISAPTSGIVSFEGNIQKDAYTSMLGERDKTFIEKLRTYINDHIADSDMSVESIGSELGLSRTQLFRKVKALTGQSPVELIRAVRLNRAKILLMQTDKSISEICYEVGFTSPSYFTKCYKEMFGIGPSEARVKE